MLVTTVLGVRGADPMRARNRNSVVQMQPEILSQHIWQIEIRERR